MAAESWRMELHIGSEAFALWKQQPQESGFRGDDASSGQEMFKPIF